MESRVCILIAARYALTVGSSHGLGIVRCTCRQLDLEREEREAAERERRLVERELEGERSRTQALRAETAASAEAIEAERAAKFAADAEAAELRRSLDDLNAALTRERYELSVRPLCVLDGASHAERARSE